MFFGEGLGINVEDESPASVPSGATEAAVRVYVPESALEHLSATTGFGDVCVSGLRFPEPPEGQRPTSIVHTATNAGVVRLTHVQHAISFGPQRGFSTRGECRIGSVTLFEMEKIEAYFR